MIELRPFEGLGRFENDWLDAHHHFSFGEYRDPARAGLGTLLVWNDDTIAPGGGFGLHGHRDMEIITYVWRGAISHQDHLGNRGRTEAGDVQVMSAGTGIQHAEHNHEDEPTQLFQIWIRPAVERVAPRWEQRRFPAKARAGRLVPLASGRDGDRDALLIHQDAAVLGASLAAGQSVDHALGPGRKAYLVAARGQIDVNGVRANARDGVAAEDVEQLSVTAIDDAEIIVVDVV